MQPQNSGAYQLSRSANPHPIQSERHTGSGAYQLNRSANPHPIQSERDYGRRGG